MVIDDTHDVEAVRNDPGIGEEAADDIAVWTRKINTDHLDLVASAQCSQIGCQIGNASARPDVEDAVVAKVAKCGAEPLGLVQRVLVDTKVLRALERESFIRLAACELRVDAADGGRSEPLVTCDGA